MAERSHLVCADITGYTAYLSHSELDHASGILSDLLQLLLGELQEPLRLSRVEGDAVISYVPSSARFAGQVVVDRIEDMYVSFRRALEQMVRNTTCTCTACANLSTLDLKFLVHHGEFAVQRIGQQDELVGPEVNLLFRLTKNRIRERLGLPGYVAFTPQALGALELPEFAGGLREHVEEDVERGRITLAVRDMAPVWEQRRHREAFAFPADRVLATAVRILDAPLGLVWDHLTRPESRALMFTADVMELEGAREGRIGVDTVYVCAHGDKRVPQTIVDWSPPHRYAYATPIPGGATAFGQFALSEVGQGRVEVAFAMALPRGSAIAAMMRPLFRAMVRRIGKQHLDVLEALVSGVET